MYRLIITNYEDSQRQLLSENADMRKYLKQMQDELIAALNEKVLHPGTCSRRFLKENYVLNRYSFDIGHKSCLYVIAFNAVDQTLVNDHYTFAFIKYRMQYQSCFGGQFVFILVTVAMLFFEEAGISQSNFTLFWRNSKLCNRFS